MTAKLRTVLKSENATDFPDNTAGQISAADLRGQLDDIIDSATFPEDGGAGSGGITVDTGEPYRIIMLSDGTVRAVPLGATAPVPPTGLAAVVRLTSVSLHWDAAPIAHHYNVVRDGTAIGTTAGLTYRDTSTAIGQTYSYQVSTGDQYGQRSPLTTAVTAFMDPALNAAPNSVAIRCWPNPLPTDGPAFVRVNACDIDVQNIAYVLNVDVGSLRSTDDPSVWIIAI